MTRHTPPDRPVILAMTQVRAALPYLRAVALVLAAIVFILVVLPALLALA